MIKHEKSKKLIFVAGPNGAGKTTSAFSLLPDFFKTNEFVNADEIAKGLSPLNAESVAIQSGKIMLSRVRELLRLNKSFGLETTLSGRTYTALIKNARSKGYEVGLIFLYLDSVSLAQRRVAYRVSQGGHNIPLGVIERRYHGGLQNLINLYLDLTDWAYIFDNSVQNEKGPNPILYKHGESFLAHNKIWESINEQYRRG